MKKRLPQNVLSIFFTMMLYVAAFTSFKGVSQCQNATPYGNATVGATSGEFASISCQYASEYGTWNGILANYNYTTTSTMATDYITVRQGAVGGPVIASGVGPLSWMATVAGTYYIHINLDATCATATGCRNITTTNNDYAGPAAPPSPTQAAGIPSCATGTDLNVVGAPPANVTWYWQATATGTSTADAYSGPYAVFANGTYYLRAYNSVTSLWSLNSSSVTVSNFPLAVAPPAPTADLNPACVTSGSILTAATPGAGYQYYWQGTNAVGSSTALPATSTYTATTSGTYYLAAYETTSQCWSAGTGLAVVIETAIPSAPGADTSVFYYCTSAAAMPVSAELPADGICSVTATASGIDNSGLAPSITDFSCATGTIMGATLNATIGGVCPGWYDYDIIVNGVTVATGQCNQTGFDLTPYLPLTSVSLLSYDNDFFGDFINLTLTVNLNYQAGTSLSWYDVATGGTPFATGLTVETIGSPVMPVAATGSYEYYARTNLGACTSATSTLVTVNVSDVVVTLDPQDVSCNNGNDGTFAISNVDCGSAPFQFSVNGGAFGAIPTDLTVGTYTVIVQDATTNLSDEYTIEIMDAAAPSGLVINTFSSDMVDLSWLAGGSETSWNVEWGVPGFLPGTGAQIGMASATDTNYVISGLDGNTEYQFYISANCGAGTTTGDWISISQTTLCDPFVAQGFCESFDADSETEACWSTINGNGDFYAWETNGTLGAYGGTGESAMLYTDFNQGVLDEWLISPALILTGNEILSFKYRTYSSFEPNDVRVMLSTTGTAAADFTTELAGLFTVGNTEYLDSSINLSAYTGTCYIAFHVPAGGLDGWFLMIDEVCVDICTPDAGTDGTVDVCRLSDSLDLNTVITQGENNGVWEFAPNQNAISGSSVNLTAIPDGTFDMYYLVTTACVVDTTVATLTIYPPSSAGTDGQINVCKNQPLNLLAGLSGTVDHGGTWFNSSSVALPSGQIMSGSLAGFFNYDYVTSNGVCPNDTSNVIVIVSSTCDWAGLDELNSDAITVYPNPSTGMFYITNSDASQNFNYEVLDLNGRVIVEATKEVNGNATIEVNLTQVENGIYMIKLFNESGAKLVRVVKQ